LYPIQLINESITEIHKQYPINAGIIDLFAKTRENELFIFEIKKRIITHKAVGQIQVYIQSLNREDSIIKGIIIGNTISTSAKESRDVSIFKDRISIKTFKEIINNKTKIFVKVIAILIEKLQNFVINVEKN